MKLTPRFGFIFMAACAAVAVTIILSTQWRLAGSMFAGFTGLLFAAGVGLLYILPSVIAGIRDHRQLMPIAVINVFAGWSCVGWLAALAWSVAAFDRK